MKRKQFQWVIKLEAQWAEPVSLTFHSALRKLNRMKITLSLESLHVEETNQPG